MKSKKEHKDYLEMIPFGGARISIWEPIIGTILIIILIIISKF